MDVWELVEGLAATDEAARGRARRLIPAVGSVAVVPVLAGLHEGAVPWNEGVAVLRRTGLDGFGIERRRVAAVVEAVVSAPEATAVRGAPVRRLWAELVEAARWMRDPSRVGEKVVPMLYAVRRSPLRQRHDALKVLAEIGWRHLDARDKATMRRFLATKARRERHDKLHEKWPYYAPCTEWYALETEDQEAVLAEFNLSGPVAAPVIVGISATSLHGRLEGLSGSDPEHPWCCRVYVSPAVNGWTLVFGVPVTAPLPSRSRSVQRHGYGSDWMGTPPKVVVPELRRLSRRFGRAWHFRSMDDVADPLECNVWRSAQDGEITCEFLMSATDLVSDQYVRAGLMGQAEYDNLLRERVPENDTFPRRPGESLAGWAQRWSKWLRDEKNYAPDLHEISESHHCLCVAQRMSAWFLPDARIEGTGMLALTECGRRFGHRGLLPLHLVKEPDRKRRRRRPRRR